MNWLSRLFSPEVRAILTSKIWPIIKRAILEMLQDEELMQFVKELIITIIKTKALNAMADGEKQNYAFDMAKAAFPHKPDSRINRAIELALPEAKFELGLKS